LEARILDSNIPLLLAVANGYSTTVDLLLEKGADPKAKDKLGWNTIYCVANSRQDSILQPFLIKEIK
jgi:ankyrin repeat protein